MPYDINRALYISAILSTEASGISDVTFKGSIIIDIFGPLLTGLHVYYVSNSNENSDN